MQLSRGDAQISQSTIRDCAFADSFPSDTELLIKIEVGALAATLQASQKYRLLALTGRGHVAVHVAATTGRAWWNLFGFGDGVSHGSWVLPVVDVCGLRLSISALSAAFISALAAPGELIPTPSTPTATAGTTPRLTTRKC
jgi:hypothetical protein